MIQHAPSHPDPAALRPRHWWQTPRGKVAAVVLGVIALGLIVWWGRQRPDGRASAAAQAVPVTVATARQATFIVYRSEPGTVTPSNRVVVRSRVQGELARTLFSGGQKVEKGDLLAEIDPRPFQAQLQLATGDLARSRALLGNAQDTLKRYQALLKQDSIAHQRVADQASRVRQYTAEVDADQGRIDSARLQLSYTRITAPITGIVGLRRVDPGNLVGPSDARGIAVVTQSQPSRVVFSVPAAVAGRVRQRLQAGDCIPVQAYADGAQDDVLGSGYVRAVDNEVDPATGTVRFEAEFANAAGALLPNQFVTARLPVETLPQATQVPSAAIQHGADGAFVYAMKDARTVAVRPVEIGPGDATSTVVEKGLAPGTKVVIEGADRLRAGTVVAPHEAASAPAPADVALSCRRDQEGGRSASAHGARSRAARGRVRHPLAGRP